MRKEEQGKDCIYEEKMDSAKVRVQKLIDIIRQLEWEFPGRHFTLDGHLFGSIGEVMAGYDYGIEKWGKGDIWLIVIEKRCVLSYNCDKRSEKMDILSIISLAVTIILGGYAVHQSWKYNKDTEKIFSDIKYMLVQQTRLLNELEKGVSIVSKKVMVMDLSKDEIELHKLCVFNKNDIPQIMDAIKHLSIKNQFLKKIESFLNSDDTTCRHNFRGKADCDEEVSIEELYAILLEYNVLMSIKYY